jgi:glycosyltransferase involved in cell wall biosynthesis
LNKLERRSKTCALIPIYNEENFIFEVINKTLPFVDKIFVVNDGSTDNSVNIIKDIQKIEIINHSNNQGKGKALFTGLSRIINDNFDFVITLDGDLQHDPSYIPHFIKALEKYDFVIGNRLNNLKDMPLQRITSNKITSFLISIKSGKKILDSQSGYRGFKVKYLEKYLPTKNGYEAESEMILKAAKLNLSFGFVDIPTIYGEEKSKMSPFKTTFNFIRLILSRS